MRLVAAQCERVRGGFAMRRMRSAKVRGHLSARIVCIAIATHLRWALTWRRTSHVAGWCLFGLPWYCRLFTSAMRMFIEARRRQCASCRPVSRQLRAQCDGYRTGGQGYGANTDSRIYQAQCRSTGTSVLLTVYESLLPRAIWYARFLESLKVGLACCSKLSTMDLARAQCGSAACAICAIRDCAWP